MALSCSRISQAMLSKKVMLAKAADARRKTSPQEAVSHNSERIRRQSLSTELLISHDNTHNERKVKHEV